MDYSIEHCPSGVPCGRVVTHAATHRGAVKKLRSVSKGGLDRNYAIVRDGKVVMSSAALVVPCSCGHPRQSHVDHDAIYRPLGTHVVVEKCMEIGCECMFYRHVRPVTVHTPDTKLVGPTEDLPADSSAGRIIT